MTKQNCSPGTDMLLGRAEKKGQILKHLMQEQFDEGKTEFKTL